MGTLAAHTAATASRSASNTTKPIGTMSDALSRHADEAFNELPDERSRTIAEKLFKALTERGADNREIRRPTRMDALCEIAGARRCRR